MRSLLRKFFRASVALSERLERLVPQSPVSLEKTRSEGVAKDLTRKGRNIVADIGGGRSSPSLRPAANPGGL